MDLMAPNPEIMRSGFIQVGVVIVTLLTAAVKRMNGTGGLPLWLRSNAPLVAIVLGEAWAVTAWFAFRVVDVIDPYFIVGLWVAGGSSLLASVWKDMADKSVVTWSR